MLVTPSKFKVENRNVTIKDPVKQYIYLVFFLKSFSYKKSVKTLHRAIAVVMQARETIIDDT